MPVSSPMSAKSWFWANNSPKRAFMSARDVTSRALRVFL